MLFCVAGVLSAAVMLYWWYLALLVVRQCFGVAGADGACYAGSVNRAHRITFLSAANRFSAGTEQVHAFVSLLHTDEAKFLAIEQGSMLICFLLFFHICIPLTFLVFLQA